MNLKGKTLFHRDWRFPRRFESSQVRAKNFNKTYTASNKRIELFIIVLYVKKKNNLKN